MDMVKWQPLEEEAQALASHNTCNLLTTSMRAKPNLCYI